MTSQPSVRVSDPRMLTPSKASPAMQGILDFISLDLWGRPYMTPRKLGQFWTSPPPSSQYLVLRLISSVVTKSLTSFPKAVTSFVDDSFPNLSYFQSFIFSLFFLSSRSCLCLVILIKLSKTL